MQDRRTGALRAMDRHDRRTASGVPISDAHRLQACYRPRPGVVFAGDNEGNFSAFDATSGNRICWHYPTGANLWGSAPMTYMLDGRQFVLVATGATLVAFALPLS